MPERVECQIFIDQLNDKFRGQTLQDITIVGGRFLKNPFSSSYKLITPLHNTKFHCRGKTLYWTFDDDPDSINFLISLGMTGSFGSFSKHSAIKFTFDNGEIYFNDIRHFGTFKIVNDNALSEKLTSLRWDILTEQIPDNLPNQVRGYNNKTISEVLLNQNIFSGCGNYLKNETLYAAKIHPLRLVKDLSNDDIILIAINLQAIVKEAYNYGGATLSTYKDMYGNSGKFSDFFNVYGKKTDKFGNKIVRSIAPDKRSIYYVEEIQK